ncbi:MAG: hypothetical protein U9N63_15150, partial [Pseudomonadota bacterium]|nr:hypothetical protein [Pseudomonadota bacterium]
FVTIQLNVLFKLSRYGDIAPGGGEAACRSELRCERSEEVLLGSVPFEAGRSQCSHHLQWL